MEDRRSFGDERQERNRWRGRRRNGREAKGKMGIGNGGGVGVSKGERRLKRGLLAGDEVEGNKEQEEEADVGLEGHVRCCLVLMDYFS